MTSWKQDAVGLISQIAVTLEAKENININISLFPYRSDPVARTYKGPFPVQHPVKDPATACRDQGCQAAVKGDEERKGVSHHL